MEYVRSKSEARRTNMPTVNISALTKSKKTREIFWHLNVSKTNTTILILSSSTFVWFGSSIFNWSVLIKCRRNKSKWRAKNGATVPFFWNEFAIQIIQAKKFYWRQKKTTKSNLDIFGWIFSCNTLYCWTICKFYRFPIHSIALAAASQYFSALFGSKFEEGKTKEFVLEGADGGTVKAIVDYCYTGQIDLTKENVGQILTIATNVGLDLLEAACRQFYDKKLCVTNCVDAFVAADKYGYADVRRKAFNLICHSFEKLSSAEIQKLDDRLLQEVLKCDEIKATEEFVFNQLVEWCQNKGNDCERYMPELLKLVRLEHLSHQVRFATYFQIFFPNSFFFESFIRSFSVVLWRRFTRNLIVRSSFSPNTNDGVQINARMILFVDRPWFWFCLHSVEVN